MKRLNIWAQLAVALLAVFSILAILQGVISARRAAANAAYEDSIECNVDLDPALIEQGQIIYAGNCIACHGTELKGSADWETPLADGSNPPPPLNSSAHAWQHSDSSLVYTITNGRNPGKLSSMPAFGETLSQQEIQAVIEFVKSTWRNSQLNQQDLLNE